MSTPKYRRLLNRRVPLDEQPQVITNFSAKEASYGESTKYIIKAMAPVAKGYTDKLIEQGDRVEKQLKHRLQTEYPGLAFRRQGSVSNNTHIRYRSDVDVLIVIDKFYTVEPPLVPEIPYLGNVEVDLITLRRRCKEELQLAFWGADIDDSGATCVTLSGGSFVCSVDAVPANWLNTVAWSNSKNAHERGIQVYNKNSRERSRNYPFLYNYRVDVNDTTRFGIPRCLMRLLKNIKADEEEEGRTVELSSFDICSIVYRIPDAKVNYGARLRPLVLVEILLVWMAEIIRSSEIRTRLMAVDESRFIFNDASKEEGLRKLFLALHKIYDEAVKENPVGEVLTEEHMS